MNDKDRFLQDLDKMLVKNMENYKTEEYIVTEQLDIITFYDKFIKAYNTCSECKFFLPIADEDGFGLCLLRKDVMENHEECNLFELRRYDD